MRCQPPRSLCRYSRAIRCQLIVHRPTTSRLEVAAQPGSARPSPVELTRTALRPRLSDPQRYLKTCCWLQASASCCGGTRRAECGRRRRRSGHTDLEEAGPTGTLGHPSCQVGIELGSSRRWSLSTAWPDITATRADLTAPTGGVPDRTLTPLNPVRSRRRAGATRRGWLLVARARRHVGSGWLHELRELRARRGS